jgi:hypothetical protein
MELWKDKEEEVLQMAHGIAEERGQWMKKNQKLVERIVRIKLKIQGISEAKAI